MDAVSRNSYGELTSAGDNTIIHKIHGYVLIILSGLTVAKNENENAITNRFCIDLNTKRPPEFPFYFHHQNIEDNRKGTSTDFAVFETIPFSEATVFQGSNTGVSAGATSLPGNPFPRSIAKFEAKRLNSTLGKGREKEYVLGEYRQGKRVKNSGGIERFKNGQHGSDVQHAAIIGYIQTDTPDYWHKKVNGWIEEEILDASDKELFWCDKDLLVKERVDGGISCYTSFSARLAGDDIKLKHFWILSAD